MRAILQSRLHHACHGRTQRGEASGLPTASLPAYPPIAPLHERTPSIMRTDVALWWNRDITRGRESAHLVRELAASNSSTMNRQPVVASSATSTCPVGSDARNRRTASRSAGAIRPRRTSPRHRARQSDLLMMNVEPDHYRHPMPPHVGSAHPTGDTGHPSTSFTDRSPRMPASTISSFCCALQLRYLRCSLNLVSLSVERPILSRPPAATIFPSDWTATA
jgi:hypothetical protein